MTILLGSLLGGGGLYLLRQDREHQPMPLRWGALLPAFFWTDQAGAFAFPGVKGLEAEFPELVPKAGPFRINETAVSTIMLTLIGVGFILAKTPKTGTKKA